MSRLNVTVIMIMILLVPVLVSGQSFYLQDQPADKARITLRFFHPQFKAETPRWYYGVYDLSLSVPITNRLNVVGELPFAYCWFESIETFAPVPKSSLMNLSLGLQYKFIKKPQHTASITAGAYLPTAKSNALFGGIVGETGDFYDLQKYSLKTWSIYTTIAYNYHPEKGVLFSSEISPRVMFPKHLDMAYVYINYGASLGYRFNDWVIKGELVGNAYLNGDYELNERLDTMASFGIHWMRGKINPGVYYGIYLDKEYRDFAHGVIGIKVDISL